MSLVRTNSLAAQAFLVLTLGCGGVGGQIKSVESVDRGQIWRSSSVCLKFSIQAVCFVELKEEKNRREDEFVEQESLNVDSLSL